LLQWLRNDTIYPLSLLIWQQKGGADMSILISFLVSVIASIVGYYICKWLDGDDSDN